MDGMTIRLSIIMNGAQINNYSYMKKLTNLIRRRTYTELYKKKAPFCVTFKAFALRATFIIFQKLARSDRNYLWMLNKFASEKSLKASAKFLFLSFLVSLYPVRNLRSLNLNSGL